MENVFAANPSLNKLYVFEDGTCFGEKNYNDALNYAAKNKLTFKVVERSTEEKPQPKKDKK